MWDQTQTFEPQSRGNARDLESGNFWLFDSIYYEAGDNWSKNLQHFLLIWSNFSWEIVSLLQNRRKLTNIGKVNHDHLIVKRLLEFSDWRD